MCLHEFDRDSESSLRVVRIFITCDQWDWFYRHIPEREQDAFMATLTSIMRRGLPVRDPIGPSGSFELARTVAIHLGRDAYAIFEINLVGDPPRMALVEWVLGSRK
jgi:hypothetical protein